MRTLNIPAGALLAISLVGSACVSQQAPRPSSESASAPSTTASGPGSTVIPSTRPPPTTTEPPTPVPVSAPPTENVAVETWQIVAQLDPLGQAELNGVAAGPTGFVAIG